MIVKNAILSSTIVLQPGTFVVERITLSEARDWVKENEPVCFSTHDTVKILGVEPAKNRLACTGYETALCIKPNHRLDFAKQYTKDEVEEIGVRCFLIKKIGD